MKKRTLNFSQAARSASPSAFSVMVKPIGSACNLRCDYCYYLDKEDFHHKGTMSEQTTELFVRGAIEGNDVEQITFCFHGGEPLLAGIPYFESVIKFQRLYAAGKEIVNNVQTNGTLVDERWAQFFKEHNFLVGISIDGPQDVHNARRGGSWARAMRGLEFLRNAGVEFNTLSAVSSASAGRGAEIYRFFRSIGSSFHQYLPVAEFLSDDSKIATQGDVASWSITAKEWGRFCKDVFEQWVVDDVGRVYVSLFDATLAGYCGVQPGGCALGENCGSTLVVEHTGDVYSCDHFVYPDYRLGSVAELSLLEMYRSAEHFRFGASKSSGASSSCRACMYWSLCRGECPKHRDVMGDNLLCGGYKEFFRYSRPYFEKMRELLESGFPPSMVMDFARQRMGL